MTAWGHAFSGGNFADVQHLLSEADGSSELATPIICCGFERETPEILGRALYNLEIPSASCGSERLLVGLV